MSHSDEPEHEHGLDDTPAILVVDDLPANLRALEAALAPLGVTIVTADSSASALDAISRRAFAVIVLDVRLPEMDGYELARRIRKLKARSETPIIFVTARDRDPEQIAEGYDSGGVDFLVKPLDLDILRAKVQSFVRLHQEHEQRLAREQRRAIKLAAESAAARAQAILESITDAFYAVDADFQFTYVNRKAEEWWHRGREALIGESLWRAFPSIAQSEAYSKHLEVMRERTSVHFEMIAPTTGKWIDVSLYPEASGGLSCYFRDIDDRKRAEEEREQLLQEAQAARVEAESASRVKSEFLATMSHELRTPLNALIGYAELMEAELPGPLTEQQRLYLARICASSEHLLALVNDVLEIARTGSDQTPVASEQAYLGEAVSSAVALVAPQAAERRIALHDGVSCDPGASYVGDPARVRQVLVNLIENAVKFTPPGGQVIVSCGTASQGPAGTVPHGGESVAFVRISDTGIGIAHAEIAAIFEPFHQVERGHTRTHDGTGLGLAISRQLAHRMGGDITVESTPGVGSAFTLWLPAGSPQDTPGPLGAGTSPADSHVSLQTSSEGLISLGNALRAGLHRVMRAYVQRLRAESTVPHAHAMRSAELEDHALSLVADFAQTLVIIGGAGPDAPALLRDSSAIERTVAEQHGRRRHAQGWTEASLRHDYTILREEVLHDLAKPRKRGGIVANDEALRVLVGFIERAQDVAVAAWRQVDRRAQAAANASLGPPDRANT